MIDRNDERIQNAQDGLAALASIYGDDHENLIDFLTDMRHLDKKRLLDAVRISQYHFDSED